MHSSQAPHNPHGPLSLIVGISTVLVGYGVAMAVARGVEKDSMHINTIKGFIPVNPVVSEDHGMMRTMLLLRTKRRNTDPGRLGRLQQPRNPRLYSTWPHWTTVSMVSDRCLSISCWKMIQHPDNVWS